MLLSSRRSTVSVACLIACLVSLQAQGPSTGRRPIRLDDLFEIKRVGDPRFSPDSGWVAYTVSESSLEKDRSETSIWMASTTDGAEIRMTRKGTSGSQPRWSPDGRYLSFRSGRPEREFQSGEPGMITTSFSGKRNWVFPGKIVSSGSDSPLSTTWRRL